ncbi:Asp-tRNA(Asn)/Glu-tRNA(Gln) amidotransferase subunit GatC [Candidatus Methylacidithermus pantelleriae]|uniref:Aspartyl/glutamyl-tRNA(Asn/Gln) amidotransferase subunit C n=1 Tax=Candidatus Methylacidithermus pantelleriae TaxID=2744239 RepID=A0A8J2FW32_9BACT|nr:Asp-tRNA(Asn)/Glu-tRNA(Gln) amidotransferase subunit GatC [Candidatus Methylacidithermus pantelleriae]CAF0697016.1 Aspartyl/glutamyl-tRNA(Asn/Gln) amidotransferase subunit C [Candidatus Methylacidithermus pantelleriae]
MAAVEIDVAYVAELARLRLTPEETQAFQRQLGDVLAYVAKLRELDVSGVSLEGEEESCENRLRADIPRPGLGQDVALANSPQRIKDFFIVPKIVE